MGVGKGGGRWSAHAVAEPKNLVSHFRSFASPAYRPPFFLIFCWISSPPPPIPLLHPQIKNNRHQVAIKPQHVEQYPRICSGTVQEALAQAGAFPDSAIPEDLDLLALVRPPPCRFRPSAC